MTAPKTKRKVNHVERNGIQTVLLTVYSGTPAYTSAARNDSSASIEVGARFSDMEGDSSAVRREVLEESAGLNMKRDVTRMLATFNNEDLERGIGSSQSSCDDTSSCSAWG